MIDEIGELDGGIGARAVAPGASFDLRPMLEAASVAVVGASERPGSVGNQVMRQLLGGGFAGSVHPVNPRYSTLHGLKAVPSVSDLPGPVDHAVLAVANDRLEGVLAECLDAGARSTTIFASCHGPAADGTSLRDRLAAMATAAGAPVCGGNGMGFVNLDRALRVCGFYQPFHLEPGTVTFLTHSGSLFSAMLHNRRSLRFNVVVSTGIELTTTMDQYLTYALGLPTTRAVAMFLETVRRPDAFAAALGAAADADVPVVALKVGTTERGQRAVATHSEALAGDDAAFEALFAACNVTRVSTMDEMADTLELMTARRRPAPGGLGVVHDSGGERALLIDTAHTAGVPLADVSSATEKRIGAVLDPGLDPTNPVDAWGTGRGATDVFAECLAALADDPAVGLVAFCVDLTSEEVLDDAGPPLEAYAEVAAQVSAGTDKPVVVLANLASAADPEQAAALRSAGVPVLEGTLTGLQAIAHFLARRDHPTASPLPRTTRRPGSAEAMLESADEAATLRLLQSYGITTSRFVDAATIDEVLAAAADIGYPVALKTATPGVVHKSDAGGVVLGLADPQALAAAYADLAGRLGPGALVAEMAPAGLELALGMVRDPSFGPLVVLAAGGVLVEAIGRRAVALAPLDLPGAQRLITALGLDPLLDDLRGVGPLDRAALANTVVRFSELASDLPGVVTAVDVNPVIVHRLGCVAVDGVMSTDASAR